MENSRKLYELATGQLVTFLEQVSASLASTASLRGSRLHLEEAGLSRERLQQARDLSLASLAMARSQSLPGLAGSLPPPRRQRRLPPRDQLRRSSSGSRQGHIQQHHFNLNFSSLFFPLIPPFFTFHPIFNKFFLLPSILHLLFPLFSLLSLLFSTLF